MSHLVTKKSTREGRDGIYESTEYIVQVLIYLIGRNKNMLGW